MSSNPLVFWSVYAALVAGITYLSSDKSSKFTDALIFGISTGGMSLLCTEYAQEIASGILGLGRLMLKL